MRGTVTTLLPRCLADRRQGTLAFPYRDLILVTAFAVTGHRW
jgi:hypothetical protein